MTKPDVTSHVEELFAAEAALRRAASEWGREKTNTNAKDLRAAAIAYSEAAERINAAVESTLENQ